MSELKLFVVSLENYVDYWVAAYAAEGCEALIRAVDCDEPTGSWEINEMDLADAQVKYVHDDDSTHPSGKTSLAELFGTYKTPGIVACSEW